MKQARSGIELSNLQEVLDAEDSAKWATLGYQQQYETPQWLADRLAQKLNDSVAGGIRYGSKVYDPQCAKGVLLECMKRFGYSTGGYIYGSDIDSRITDAPGFHFMRGNCVKIMDDLIEFGDGKPLFDVCNANPPFGKRWTLKDGSVIDSTAHTWEMVRKLGDRGIFIANAATIKRLGYDKDPWTKHYEEHANVWPNCDVVIGCIIWDLERDRTYRDCGSTWSTVSKIQEEERHDLPEHNIFLHYNGKLGTYLSTRAKIKRKISRDDVLRLSRVSGQFPLTLTTEKETRSLMAELVSSGIYTISPDAKRAIEDALAQVEVVACPIMPVTDFEKVAYADEEDMLKCKLDVPDLFTAGKSYKLKTATYDFVDRFERKKVKFDEATQTMFTATHECTLSGKDRLVAVTCDNGHLVKFKDRIEKHEEGQWCVRPESDLFRIFEEPAIRTVKERFPEKVEANLSALRMLEMMAGFTYYPGQMDYLSRVAVKDSGLIGADTGCGKTLMAISLIAMKAPKRALIVAPQGTMKSGEDDEDDESAGQTASQWVQELRRFAPYLPVFEVFNLDDYNRILALNKGQLPSGVYVSYFEAMFQNGGRETKGATWTNAKFAAECRKIAGIEVDISKADKQEDDGIGDRDLSDSVGQEKNGIRCIMKPCLATLIGDHFDMVCIDEAHKMCNMDANITQMAIRLQPKYRFAFTATPIPNTIANLFSLMGWICVPGWYQGGLCNASFPYAREHAGVYEAVFQAKERDLTQEHINKQADKGWNGKCEKVSLIISSPARLLKLLKPTMSFISKPMCNPSYVPPEILDIRVPMGRQQAALYSHFMNRANIPCKSPLIRARKQIAYLRNICADPAGFTHGGPPVGTNFNPKMITILDLVAQIAAKGEQFVLISSRVGQTSAIQQRLIECGITCSRIDSTVAPSDHSRESNAFKARQTQGMLMGIKCAVGYSFPECPYEIIGSLEYSYGSLHQAKGRVDRVNSTKPRKIFCVLNKFSIEEVMFDLVATKQDSANICLHGKRIPRDFKAVDMAEVMANALDAFDATNAHPETDCLKAWPELRSLIRTTNTFKQN